MFYIKFMTKKLKVSLFSKRLKIRFFVKKKKKEEEKNKKKKGEKTLVHQHYQGIPNITLKSLIHKRMVLIINLLSDALVSTFLAIKDAHSFASRYL